MFGKQTSSTEDWELPSQFRGTKNAQHRYWICEQSPSVSIIFTVKFWCSVTYKESKMPKFGTVCFGIPYSVRTNVTCCTLVVKGSENVICFYKRCTELAKFTPAHFSNQLSSVRTWLVMLRLPTSIPVIFWWRQWRQIKTRRDCLYFVTYWNRFCADAHRFVLAIDSSACPRWTPAV